jgi:hypothetical protein
MQAGKVTAVMKDRPFDPEKPAPSAYKISPYYLHPTTSLQGILNDSIKYFSSLVAC